MLGNPPRSGVLKIPNDRRQRSAAAGNFGARQPPANAFFKKEKGTVRNYVPPEWCAKGTKGQQELCSEHPL